MVLQTPAPYTHALNADPTKYGDQPNVIPWVEMKFKGGSAETVASVFLIQMTFKELVTNEIKRLRN
jgi:hypothetical protein